MSIFLALSFLFFIGCLSGWILELFYRRLAHHKWINPGFLTGPYLPLYGSGLALMFCICYFSSKIDTGNTILNNVIVIAIITVAMTLLEYVTGLIFIVHMKIKLWDYSSRWGNIQGIICPLFSLFWGIIGAAYYFFLHPLMLKSLDWFGHNLAFSFVIGFFFGVMAIDAAFSFKLTAKIRAWAVKNNVVVRYEEFKESVHDRIGSMREKQNFFFPIKSPRSLFDELDNYVKSHPIIKKK